MNIVSHDFRKLTGRDPEKLSSVLQENKDLILSGTPTDYTGRPVSLGKTPAP